MTIQAIDEVGKKYGFLTILRRAEVPPGTGAKWVCACECGIEKVINGTALRRGTTVSCGCYARRQARERGRERLLQHGGTGTRTFSSWCSMKARCERPSHMHFKNYGGRGITVCERWQSFAIFRADMGDVPKGMSIERRDNNMGYEPGNCCWATLVEQANNRRDNRYFTSSGGERKTVAEWARKAGVIEETMRWRLVHRGWDVDRAISQAVRRKHVTAGPQSHQ